MKQKLTKKNTMSTPRVHGQGNHEKKQTNNPKDPKTPASASNRPELAHVMEARDALHTSEPPPWFTAEMQKFAATI